MIVTQRSSLETAEHCNRRWFWAYAYNGRGIERRAVAVPLLTGSSVHEPLAEVLSFVLKHDKIPEPTTLDAIVKRAQHNYVKVVRERGLLLDSFDGSDEQTGTVLKLDGEQSSPVAWQVNEQLALLEALVKGWVAVRLPLLLDEYEIVDVEQEQEVQLTPDIVMLTRRDALLRRKQTGEYFVLNFKTTSNPDKTWLEQWRCDQQTISEFVAAEASLAAYMKKMVGDPDNYLRAEVRGVLIEGLVKGQRKLKWPEDAEPAQWRHNSPLLYHYITPDNPPLPRSMSASGYWTCPEAHKWQWVKGGMCPGGKKHQLGKEYQRQMVTQTIGFDAWLKWLQENEPEVLAAQFVSVPAILRSAYDIERWKTMTIQHTYELHTKAEKARTGWDLDRTFRMSTASANCLRPSRCSYFDICWGAGDPDDPQQFVLRTFNHPREAELINIAEVSK